MYNGTLSEAGREPLVPFRTTFVNNVQILAADRFLVTTCFSIMSSLTPKRIYCKSNICVICGFSFIYRDVLPSGEVVIQKHLKDKRKCLT